MVYRFGNSFVSSQSTRVTDGQTDRQNYDPQDRASIAASRFQNIRNSQTLNLLNQECNSSTVVPLSANVTSQRGIESLFMSPASINLMCFTLYSYCEGRNFAILLKFVSSDMTVILYYEKSATVPNANRNCRVEILSVENKTGAIAAAAAL